MSKFNEAQDAPDNTIEGAKKQDTTTFFVRIQGAGYQLKGIAPCPECGTTLNRDTMADKWECPACHTTYTTYTLIMSIVNESNATKRCEDEQAKTDADREG